MDGHLVLMALFQPGDVVRPFIRAQFFSSEGAYLRHEIDGFFEENSVGVVVRIDELHPVPYRMTWVLCDGTVACIASSQWERVRW